MKKYIIVSLAFASLVTGCNSNDWDVTSDLSVDKIDPTVGFIPVAEKAGMDYAPLY
jgi:glucan 1,6-alpha-isomaltosidase